MVVAFGTGRLSSPGFENAGEKNGFRVSGFAHRLLCHQRSPCLRPGTTAEAIMSWVYILSGLLALGILIYLVVALLFPEKF
jgi:K+-transporting ATPase KdpF subunit